MACLTSCQRPARLQGSCTSMHSSSFPAVFQSRRRSSERHSSCRQHSRTFTEQQCSSVWRSPPSLASAFSRRSRHVARSAATAGASAVDEVRHILPDGVGLEVLVQKSTMGQSGRPPLLFVHGSYHSAWCWKEHFLPYFAARGYDAYAVSMRCQGKSDRQDGLTVAGTLDTHAKDLADLIELLPGRPVVVAHSFGGLILQKYILGMTDGSAAGFPQLAGAAFLCATPPSGNKEIVMRFLKKDLFLSLRVTWGFVGKSFARSLDACKELFFSKDIPTANLQRYQQQLAACSPIRMIDLQDMNKQVPLPPAPKQSPPAFVLGATEDIIVDMVAVEETARYFGVKPVVVPATAHDCMLDTRWELTAQALESWLTTLKP